MRSGRLGLCGFHYAPWASHKNSLIFDRQGHALAAWSSQEAATDPKRSKSYCGVFYGLSSMASHVVGEEATAPKCCYGQFHKQQALLHRVGGLGSKASHVVCEEASRGFHYGPWASHKTSLIFEVEPAWRHGHSCGR